MAFPLGEWRFSVPEGRKASIVEVDGFAAHGHRRAFEADRRRDLDLRNAGWIVVRFSYRQLTDEPERVIAHVARLLVRAIAG